MALSEDQKAMLRLLAQRGEQGYEDLSALLGIGPDEVYAKAQEAAAQLEAEGIPAPTIPPSPGGAAPEPVKAEEAPPPKEEPAESSPPEPEPAPSPAEPAAQKPAPTAAKPSATPSPRSGFELPSGKGARAAVAASALVVLAFVLILLLSGGDDSGDGSTTAQTTAADGSSNLPTAGKDVTKAILSPVDGGSGSGVAIFGRVKNSLVLQIAAEGLEPTSNGQSYTIWLSQSPRKMLPLAATKATQNGQIAASAEVPTELLGYLANETFTNIAITKTIDSRLQASLKAATAKKEVPAYTGAEVLRGPVTGPIVGAAKRQEEEGQP
jgi:hypothetical protein